MKRILIELSEELQAEIDAFRHAKTEQLGFDPKRQKIIVMLLKLGLKEG